MEKRFVVAVTSGEPAGIGPDICLALAHHPVGHAGPCRLAVLADRALLADRACRLGVTVTFRDFDPALPPPPAGTLDILHWPLVQPASAGRLDPANAAYVLSLLDRALQGCQQGEFSAMVTAPIHKGVINDGLSASGSPCMRASFTGHTEYLAEKTGAASVVMMLAGESRRAHTDGWLRVALVTTHLPLREVAAAITPERLATILRTLRHGLRENYGLRQPRLLVAGLNPHAGEGGYLGREEIDIIQPVLEKLRQEEGMALTGPLPADTLFTPPVLAQGDAVLAMYHDQGLAPLKYAVFGRGINITLGLPVIRTSVDHGVALSLAGSGQAKPDSLFAAVGEAIRQVTAQRQFAATATTATTLPDRF
jgi:4-hydroxythreonine-4-phosphate dehydrogenase